MYIIYSPGDYQPANTTLPPVAAQPEPEFPAQSPAHESPQSITPAPPVQTPSQNAGMIGYWNGNVYTNNYLGIQIAVPDDWNTFDFISTLLHGNMSEWAATMLAADTLEDTLDWYIEDGIISDEFWELAEEYDTRLINVMAADSSYAPDSFVYTIRVAFDNKGFSNVDELYNAYVLEAEQIPSTLTLESQVRIGNNDWYLFIDEYTGDWGISIRASYITVIDGITIGFSAFVIHHDSTMPNTVMHSGIAEMLSWIAPLP
jgi:hypothetical protein